MTTFETFHTAARREAFRLCADDSGATAIEYAMIAGFIGAVVAASITGLGSQIKTTFYDKLAALL